MQRRVLVLASFVFFGGLCIFRVPYASAMAGCGSGPCESCHSLTVREANELLRTVGKVRKVQTSPVNGLWLLEMEREGRHGVVFMDFGKKHLIAGTVFPLAPQIDAGKPAAGDALAPVLNVAAIPLEDSIVMGNSAGKKRLFVFIDPDCHYCASIYGELKSLAAMEPDLAIYLKLVPLKIHPQAYDRARAILGAKGRSAEMLDRAFSGAQLKAPEGESGRKPVDDTIRFAESAGITTTPTLVLPDGREIRGVVTAAALKSLLDDK